MKRVFSISALALVVMLLLLGSSADGRDRFYTVFDEDKPFNKVGSSTFAFLKVGVGARATAMGDAYTAVADNDIGSVFWNPAGIGKISGVQYLLSYNRWLIDTAFYCGAIAYNSPRGVFALSVRSFQTGGVEERTIYAPQGTGRMVNGNATAIGVTYASSLTDRLNLGLRFRFVQQKILDKTASTPMLDVGTFFWTGFKSSRLSMAMKNLGKDMRAGPDRSTYMPLYFTIGGAMEVYGTRDDPTYLTASLEGVYAVDYRSRWHFGGELVMAQYLAVRGGYKLHYSEETYSLGAGINVPMTGGRSISVDVSYSDFGTLLNNPVRFTLSGSF